MRIKEKKRIYDHGSFIKKNAPNSSFSVRLFGRNLDIQQRPTFAGPLTMSGVDAKCTDKNGVVMGGDESFTYGSVISDDARHMGAKISAIHVLLQRLGTRILRISMASNKRAVILCFQVRPSNFFSDNTISLYNNSLKIGVAALAGFSFLVTLSGCTAESQNTTTSDNNQITQAQLPPVGAGPTSLIGQTSNILSQGKIGNTTFSPTSDVVTIAPASQPAIIGDSLPSTNSLENLTISTLTQMLASDNAGGLPYTVNFPTGSSSVPMSTWSSLQNIADWTQLYQNVKILIIGMASPPGGIGMNQELGYNRAQSVASILIEYGVPESKIKIRSFGLMNPASSGNSSADQYENQRAVIIPGVPQSDEFGTSTKYIGCPDGPITESLCDLR